MIGGSRPSRFFFVLGQTIQRPNLSTSLYVFEVPVPSIGMSGRRKGPGLVNTAGGFIRPRPDLFTCLYVVFEVGGGVSSRRKMTLPCLLEHSGRFTVTARFRSTWTFFVFRIEIVTLKAFRPAFTRILRWGVCTVSFPKDMIPISSTFLQNKAMN